MLWSCVVITGLTRGISRLIGTVSVTRQIHRSAKSIDRLRQGYSIGGNECRSLGGVANRSLFTPMAARMDRRRETRPAIVAQGGCGIKVGVYFKKQTPLYLEPNSISRCLLTLKQELCIAIGILSNLNLLLNSEVI